MGVRVLEWEFRNKRLEGYYAHDREPAVLAVQEGLSGEARRARELEAEGYHARNQSGSSGSGTNGRASGTCSPRPSGRKCRYRRR